jgi:hypothetical protein
MNFRLSTEQVLAIRQQAQEAQNQADLAIMNNRRRVKELEQQLADERAKAATLVKNFEAARDFYNKTLRVSPNSDVLLDFNQLGFGQKLSIEDLVNSAYKDTDYTYFVRSRSGGRPHEARWDNGKWTCRCESGAIRGWCWVTRGLDKGVKVGARNEHYIVDDKGRSHVVTRTLNSVLQ